MKTSKKKKLESRGWNVGSTTEFLDLTPEESALIELKLALAGEMKKRRLRRHLTQDQVAALLKSSQSRVAKMEAGDPSVSLDLLVRCLLALGVSEKKLARSILAGSTT